MFFSEPAKFSDLCSKYVKVAINLQEFSKTSEILFSLAKKENFADQNKRTAWLALASLLTQNRELSANQIEMVNK